MICFFLLVSFLLCLQSHQISTSSFVYTSQEVTAICDFTNTTTITQIRSSWSCNQSTTINDVCNFEGLTCTSDLKVFSVDISEIAISGSIPSSIGGLSIVENLFFSENSLTGPIPSSLSLLTNLRRLHLSSNSLTGTIPSSLSLLINLFAVVLSDNSLTGSLPSSLGLLVSLEYMDLSKNSLTGPIPSSLSLSNQLYTLVLSDNLFTNSIPSSFGYFSNLQYLDLSSNSLTGSVPSSLSLLTNLQQLHLHLNSITGSIPSSFSLLTNLQYFYLDSNSFTGSIPSSLSLLINLEELYLYSNYLSGSIPSSFSLLTNLQQLDLSSNSLSGSIPSLSSLTSIRVLLLSDNSLSGEIPSSFCSLSSLQSFDLRNNSFTCQPLCFFDTLPVFIESSLPHCSHQQDHAICSLTRILNIHKMISTHPLEVYGTPIILESSHPLDLLSTTTPATTTHLISFPQVHAIDVSFDSRTRSRLLFFNISIHDHQTSTWNSNDKTHQIKRFYSSSLSVTISTFIQMSFPPWGYEIIFTPVYLKKNWSCVTDLWNRPYAQNPCEWVGITCLNNKLITHISLPTYHLTGNVGEIIPLLKNLTWLNSIDLSYNSLSGTLPLTLWSDLKTLSKVDFSNNEISGKIPESDPSEQQGRGHGQGEGDDDDDYVKDDIYFDDDDDFFDFNSTKDPSSSSSSSSSQLTLILSSNNIHGPLPVSLLNMSWISSLLLDGNSLSGRFHELYCDNSTATLFHLSNNPKLCYRKCWTDSHPLDKKSQTFCSKQPQELTPLWLGIGLCGGALLLIAIVSFKSFNNKISPDQQEKMRRLKELPIHEAILKNTPSEELLRLLSLHLQTAKERDYEGNTAVDIIVEAIRILPNVTEEILYLLVKDSLFFHPDTGEDVVEVCEHNYAWPKLVQSSEEICVLVVKRLLLENRKYIERFAKAKDSHGRESLAIATPICRSVIEHYLFLWGRFELFPGPPEHISDTCIVRFAFDRTGSNMTNQEKGEEKNKSTLGMKEAKGLHKFHSSNNGSSKRPNKLHKVAIKFMNNLAGYKNEIETYEKGNFNETFIISFLYFININENGNEELKEDSQLKGYGEYPYCIVMEAGETNLLREVLQQHFAGRDWEKIRFLFTNLINCVKNLHDCNYIHGDLKPMNILLTHKGETKLIDFDAACCLTEGHYVGSKYSSSYLPPEMFYESEGRVGVRSYERDWLTGLPQADQHLPYSLVKAHISHDIWSLGVLLYYLCVGGPLILSSSDDNILDRNDMALVLNWTNETLIKKLSNTEISNRYARNLVSMLLNRDPMKRPNCHQILFHPFITGKEAHRLPGEEPEWDVFISYRVKSDSDHAKLLYESLTSAGLKVWWDVKCLEPGENWEKGFCEGLLSSECLLCLLSREAINSSSDRVSNISNLHHDSPPDNVLLEWRLGKELKERGMISKIYPVLIGDKISGEGEETFYSDYFKSGCHPRGLEEVVIDSIEMKFCNYLEASGLGLPYQKDMGVQTIVSSITANQGGFLRGVRREAMKEIVNEVRMMTQNVKKKSGYGTLGSRSETKE